MSKSTAADDLRAAAKYIEDHGWTQGVAQRKDGSVCALGAIAQVVAGSAEAAIYGSGAPRWTEAANAMRSWLESTDHWSGRVDRWNDNFTRTQEEVTTGLEKAAAWTEEQLD